MYKFGKIFLSICIVLQAMWQGAPVLLVSDSRLHTFERSNIYT